MTPKISYYGYTYISNSAFHMVKCLSIVLFNKKQAFGLCAVLWYYLSCFLKAMGRNRSYSSWDVKSITLGQCNSSILLACSKSSCRHPYCLCSIVVNNKILWCVLLTLDARTSIWHDSILIQLVKQCENFWSHWLMHLSKAYILN